MKRYITLFECLETPSEAISALVGLLESSPTDAEAWAELSDLYVSQAMYSQACFCLEEVILIVPNAWNVRSPQVYWINCCSGTLTSLTRFMLDWERSSTSPALGRSTPVTLELKEL